MAFADQDLDPDYEVEDDEEDDEREPDDECCMPGEHMLCECHTADAYEESRG